MPGYLLPAVENLDVLKDSSLGLSARSEAWLCTNTFFREAKTLSIGALSRRSPFRHMHCPSAHVYMHERGFSKARLANQFAIFSSGVLGGFNWSSQRFGLYLMLGIGPVLRLVFSNQAFSGVGCLVYKQLHPTHLGGAG